MTRKKLNLAYIENDTMRKATFNKRKKGFVKKLHELSVLCGIEACAVINNPFKSTPEVWPSNSGVENVVDKFQMMSEMEKEKKMVNHEGFLRQNISKIVENNKKKMEENAEKTMKEAMFLLLSGNGEALQLNNQNREDLCKYIDQNLKELYHHKNQILNQSQFQYGESSSATNVVAPTPIFELGSSSIPNLDVFNSSQPTNVLWSSTPLSHKPEEDNTISSDFVPSFVGQRDYNQVGVYDQNPNLNHFHHNQNQHQFEYPNVVQDGIYNQVQIQNQQQELMVEPSRGNDFSFDG